jgi:hypothetical protein
MNAWDAHTVDDRVTTTRENCGHFSQEVGNDHYRASQGYARLMRWCGQYKVHATQASNRRHTYYDEVLLIVRVGPFGRQCPFGLGNKWP